MCKNWHQVCSKNVKKLRFHIKDKYRLNNVTGKRNSSSSRNTPETAAFFEDVELPQNVPLSDPYLTRFLNKFGQHIKCLVIHDGWTTEDLVKLLFIKCVNLEELRIVGKIPENVHWTVPQTPDGRAKLPKLKKLFFAVTNAYTQIPLPEQIVGRNQLIGESYPISENAKSTVNYFLELCPNLTSVYCPTKRNARGNPYATYAELCQADIRKVELSFCKINQYLAQKLFSSSHQANPNVCDLNLHLRLNSRGMDKLRAKNYPINWLNLHVRNMDKPGLVPLLNSIGATLKHLKLTVDFRLRMDFSWTALSNLETLHLVHYSGNLFFIRDTPKLKFLTLERFNSKAFNCERGFGYISNTLCTLKLKNLDAAEIQQSRCIKKMATFFPNVKKLSIDHACNRDVMQMYESFPLLEELRIHSDSVTHTSISGFTDWDIESILDGGYELNNFENYEKVRRLPFIGDLKRKDDILRLTL